MGLMITTFTWYLPQRSVFQTLIDEPSPDRCGETLRHVGWLVLQAGVLKDSANFLHSPLLLSFNSFHCPYLTCFLRLRVLNVKTRNHMHYDIQIQHFWNVYSQYNEMFFAKICQTKLGTRNPISSLEMHTKRYHIKVCEAALKPTHCTLDRV